MIPNGTVCEACGGPISVGDEREWFHGLVGYDAEPLFDPMHVSCRSGVVLAILEELEPHGVRQVVEHVTGNKIGPLIRGWGDEVPDLAEALRDVRN